MKILASKQFNAGEVMTVSYPATPEEITGSGRWFCEVFNATLSPLEFDTEITFESQYPVQTATFDVDLLTERIDELFGVAQFQRHSSLPRHLRIRHSPGL